MLPLMSWRQIGIKTKSHWPINSQNDSNGKCFNSSSAPCFDLLGCTLDPTLSDNSHLIQIQYFPVKYCPVTLLNMYWISIMTSTPNFCFTPQICSTVGHNIIMPIPLFQNESIIQNEPAYQDEGETYLPVLMCILITFNFKTLLDKDDTHYSD